MSMKGIDYLKSLAQWSGSGVFSLDNVHIILGKLGNPQDSASAIHVAGTNGKGSVCALLASILAQD